MSQRLHSAIVITQIALSLLLLVGAGLLLRSFLKLTNVDPGFATQRVLTMKINPPRAKYKDGIAVGNFYQQLLPRLQALPGVEAAAAVNNLPLSNESSKGQLTFADVTANAEQANLATAEVDQSAITPDYFHVMQTPLLAGRFFTSQDTRESPRVAIIDERLARRFWPNANPIGQRLTFGRFPEKVETWVEIVGVVKRLRHHRLEADVREHVYFPHTQSAKIQMTLTLRTTAEPLAMTQAVRAAVRSLDPDQPVFLVRTMNDVLAGALAPARFTLLLLLLFAGMAMLLAAVGIYGVMAHTVSQRTHEIGVRVALGAQVGDVLRLILRQGLQLAVGGIGLGVAAALLGTRILKTQLFEVSTTDPLTFIGIAMLLLAVTVLACWIPARRATKVDPLIALKCE